MGSCVRNICTKNYQNLIIGFQVTVKNVVDVFLRHSVVFSVVVNLASGEPLLLTESSCTQIAPLSQML